MGDQAWVVFDAEGRRVYGWMTDLVDASPLDIDDQLAQTLEADSVIYTLSADDPSADASGVLARKAWAGNPYLPLRVIGHGWSDGGPFYVTMQAKVGY